MKVDVTQSAWILILIWVLQLIFYLAKITFLTKLNFGIRKIFLISVVTCKFLPLAKMFGGFYKSIQVSTCGTERFNPLGIIGLYGCIGSLIIYIIMSILNLLVRRIEHAKTNILN